MMYKKKKSLIQQPIEIEDDKNKILIPAAFCNMIFTDLKLPHALKKLTYF